MHTTLCVPSKTGASVSPSPVKVLKSNPTSLQSLILWEFLLPLLDSQVGKPDVGLRTFTPVGGLLWYKCSPVCDSPTLQLWDLILLRLCPSYHLIVASPLSLDVGSFLVSSSFLLLMIVQQLVVILFSQEGVRACSSILPSWFQFLEYLHCPKNSLCSAFSSFCLPPNTWQPLIFSLTS